MDLNKLSQQLSGTAQSALPPVEKWDPPFCGDLNMEIALDGRWYYENSPIGRASLVRLFSTVLKKEGDKYFLVTPVEKVGLRVADVPFVFTDWRREGDTLTFTTQTGDEVVLTDTDQFTLRPPPADLADEDATPIPYIRVRRNLWGRLNQSAYYRLIDAATQHESASGDISLSIDSAGTTFTVGRLSA
ncbi:DUF1285 domain-containing protein [Alteromonas sp. CYL-A6]|uniref:DUF1285 domain-containing protein n=1 Tax=Alteromonas nitratireducens TaxID=3390813 RepID=UPI0034B6DC1A